MEKGKGMYKPIETKNYWCGYGGEEPEGEIVEAAQATEAKKEVEVVEVAEAAEEGEQE